MIFGISNPVLLERQRNLLKVMLGGGNIYRATCCGIEYVTYSQARKKSDRLIHYSTGIPPCRALKERTES